MNMRAVILLWLLAWQGELAAFEIKKADVHRHDGVYQLAFEVTLNAPRSTIYRTITDYAQLPQLSDMVQESRVVEDIAHDRKIRYMVMHTCLLFFCKQIRVVEIMQENGQDEIIATIVPAQSDFTEGNSVWRVLSGNPGESRLLLESRVRPDFWVPPLIGSWLIKSRMRSELVVLSQRIESLVNDSTP